LDTISLCDEIARNMGFEIVYGDTDSLFLSNKFKNSESSKEELISRFIEECNKQLRIEVEHSKTYKTALISDKEKH
jgi:DNA polymerase, archaea type